MHQLFRFALVGILATATDAVVYAVLIHASAVSHALAKTVSFISGFAIAYLANKAWTFGQKHAAHRHVIGRFAALYVATLGVNVGINALFLNHAHNVILAFIAATATSTLLNFAGQKWWVFK